MKIQIVFFICLFIASNNKIVELTHKNLPSVLRSYENIYALFHHPGCQNCRNYHQQFLQASHGTPVVGIIDCSQQYNLCRTYDIQHYPTLLKLSTSTFQLINQQEYLVENGLSQTKNSEEYLANLVISYLKQSPNYIVVLFEELGLPTIDKIIDPRIFYLQEGKLSEILSSFVRNQAGCWIFEQKNNTMQKYYCGDTYQSSKELKTTIDKYLKGQLTRTIQDGSNYEDNRIIGYNQLLYKFTTEHKVNSNCYLLYFWSKSCQFCNLKGDTHIIDRAFQIENIQWKWYTYNIDENQIIGQLQIKFLPSLVKVCPAAETTITTMKKVLTVKNVREFIEEQKVENISNDL